jgi:predicted CXXCH cytochrome family protein
VNRLLPALAAALLALAAAAADPPPVTGLHADLDCEDCHDQAPTSYTPLDCVDCHDAATNIHPVGMTPKIDVPSHLQLGEDGRLLCRTCHQLHGGDPTHKFLNTPDGVTDRAAFCAQCHGAKMTRTNPHQAQRGTARCAYCHASIPEEGERGVTRTEIVKLCDFCHDVVAKNHPRNIDPSLSFPKGLPLGKDGSWTCFTCHDPHGTTTTTHYVRPEFAQYYERGREANPHVAEWFACKACHDKSSSDEIRAPDYALRYRGDINVMCVSCHVTDRGHHPTGLPMPPLMLDFLEQSGRQLPFDADGRITCYTCHDNGCAEGEQRMTVRFYDRTSLMMDLCWSCHDRALYRQINPHVEDDRLCVQCHESRPVPGSKNRGLITVAKMVCLRCHDVNPHPAGADHLRKPTEKIKPDESLPLGAGGAVTCITCHDPHAQPPPGFPRRLRADPTEICNLCHWR